jgi:hypothetical protein
MNYKQNQSADPEIPCAAEPAVAYAARGKAAREPWEVDSAYDDFYNEGGAPPCGGPDAAPDGRTWFEWNLEHDPEFREYYEREMDKAEADSKAGKLIPHEAVVRHTQRCLETGIWDNNYGEEYKWAFTE